MSFCIDGVCYYPEFGEVMPNGCLRVKTSGQCEDGERWDGSALIAPGSEHHAAWKQIIESREHLHAQRQEELKQARQERRRFYKLVLDEDGSKL